jgi:DNA-binding transcriptional LysR family regulator
MDLRRTDLALLVSLDALLAERSVTKAADRLGISQPALSAQLARLRDLFGDPILVSSGRSMFPTERAIALQEPLHQLLNQLGALVREKVDFNPATAIDTFCICATDYVHEIFLLGALKAIAEVAPKVRVALTMFDSKHAEDDMQENRSDLLIVSERLTPQAAKTSSLFSERFVLAQRKGHPRGTALVDLDAFCALDHVLVSPEGGGFFGATDEALRALGRSRNISVSLPSFTLLPSLIRNSNLVAVMPERLAQIFGDALDLFAPPVDIPGFTIQMAWHPRRQSDPAHAWLRQQIHLHEQRIS